MVMLRVSADDLVGIRFALSPIGETVAALQILGGRSRPVELRPWREYGRAVFAGLCRRDPTVAALAELVATTSWVPDFVCAPPPDLRTTVTRELTRIGETPDERALRDLEVSSGGRPPAESLSGRGVARRVADSLFSVWSELVEPMWPRLQAIAEQDMLYRTGLLTTHGWSRALSGMNLGVRWRGSDRLEIAGIGGPDRALDGAGLTLVPCTLGGRWLALDPPESCALIYPARGAGRLWGGGGVAPDGAGRLIGETRAAVLRALDQPSTTTLLARGLGLSTGGVGDHLAVLYDAGAVTKIRDGRSVLYRRTPLGDALVEPGRGPGGRV
ncbi:ArsR/SmtB family transcription factor [Microbispora amethystogenes]|uniref:ArsR family transcriptional regulator n=1 Tax=Microbispora amethystogenes TaxID=1427754 RepID=A0ABQ4F929_9ACTN|nr:winged helix-turn-helix domain-containing protein [Microbispora amethystogenes]GIH31318.1 ArsR family transcriptional regulator [Microbispora amethystogenes]